ncbi:YggT family protein [Dasania sp. GY-MA-18]|uniref:YggT family protein n=1 Tax=Dasania phycosphaerae TaxID=2950436 RepID=A0A9J6RK82_9GAMM|nr:MULTISPECIES: YggT family protein [Dasania]MCR8922463.1 YggT family protein [Dasania sp. GY-MA-18]MCZ0864891.1 YggT family protein [Dasania phycosphaerae]MCZ0868619.1 YggT family protein [Dasania phycosphaerae]
MGALTEIGNLLIHTVFNLFLIAVLLRLLLQFARADFYNPVSQFLVKVTKPFLQPLRRVIPGFLGIDMAAVVLAVLAQMLAITLLLLMLGYGFANPLYLFMWSVLGCLGIVLNIYFFAILAVIILSWVSPGSYNPFVLLLNQLTEPVMTPFRKMLPSLGGLDLSPILVFLSINVLTIILKHLAAAAMMPMGVVIGI